MPARVRELSEKERRDQLCSQIAPIFQQACISNSNHSKNRVALHKVQIELAQFTEAITKGTTEMFKAIGERNFQETFRRMLLMILSQKKGEAAADRVVKFTGGYIKYINEKALETRQEEEDEDDQTTASRFTAYILNFLLEGFEAKDKNVRYRLLQTVAEMISHLGVIDEDQYRILREALVARLSDKEWAVRSQAVVSLTKLCGAEDISDLADDTQSIHSILLGTMSNDTSPDVRKTVLANLSVDEESLSAIIDRTRDTDTTIRKVAYDTVLAKHVTQQTPEGPKVFGPTHPRVMSVEMRELLVRNGLGDREPSVRAVVSSLLATWVDVATIRDDAAVSATAEGNVETSLLAFLELFDLNEGAIAVDALLSVFQARPQILTDLEFGDAFWESLSPEKAFLVRVFVEHCKEKEETDRLEAVLPVVTDIAFRIQECYNSLQDYAPDDEDDEFVAKTLTLLELLRLAVNLDYSDEIGRRTMAQIIRMMVGQESLPTTIVPACLEVMRTLSANERDLIRQVVEVVQDLRDAAYGDDDLAVNKESDPDKSFEENALPPQPIRKSIEDMTPEEKTRVDRVDLRCLLLCEGMLERVNSTFEENIMLDGILQDLIVPSAKRKDEVFRQMGVKCLGLCCLIATRLADRSIPLFMSMMPSAPVPIKLTLVKSLFDIFMVHENTIFKDKAGSQLEAFIQFVLQHIREEEDPKVKATLCVGTAKLVLSGMITEVNVVKNLIKAYVSPSTIENQELRQCLSFFLPAYSHSSPANQKRMCKIFVHVFLDICQDRKEAEDEDEIISSSQVVAMFVDWTDPMQLFQAINPNQEISTTDEAVHLDLAEDILKALFEKDLKVTIEKEDKRALCQIFSRLHIPDTVDDYKIRSLKLLIKNLRVRRPWRDSVCNTALTKFESVIDKKFEKQLEDFSEDEFRKLEELNELFEFLDSVIPLDDEEYIETEVPKRGRKRRSESVITTTTIEEENYGGSPPPAKGRRTRQSKRARFSTSDGDEDDDTSTPRGSMPPPRAATRTLPKRAAAGKRFTEPITISSDSEGDNEKTPGPSRLSKTDSRYRASVKDEEEQLDKEIDHLLGDRSVASASTTSEAPYDSIMDSDSEEEEGEVNDLLADE